MDHIYTLHNIEKTDNCNSIYSVIPGKNAWGERADRLSPFTRAIGGEVSIDRRDHTAKVRLFSDSNITKSHACAALLDTRSWLTGQQHEMI